VAWLLGSGRQPPALHGTGHTGVVSPMGGPTSVLAFTDRRLWAVLMHGRERPHHRIGRLADPEKIGFLGSQLSAAIP